MFSDIIIFVVLSLLDTPVYVNHCIVFTDACTDYDVRGAIASVTENFTQTKIDITSRQSDSTVERKDRVLLSVQKSSIDTGDSAVVPTSSVASLSDVFLKATGNHLEDGDGLLQQQNSQVGFCCTIDR